MMEPEIKLFGKKITLPDNGGGVSSVESSNDRNDGFDPSFQVNGEKADELPAEEDQVAQVSETDMQEKDQDQVTAEEKQNPTVSSELDQNPSIDEDSTSENNPKLENEQTDATNGTQKPLKKPDQILPCPRCNSMDTKFCYYNNYNVNQPRHFCKGCQRYWTAGGTMRNVPVGAGRRKNKNSASHCRHITIPESLQAGQVDPHNRFHHHTGFKPNGSVLSFGPDAPLCESMASGLNLAENRDDYSVAQEQLMTNMNNVAVPYPVPCISGVAWPFPTLPLPAICPPAGYPMPFYPAPYWNCGMPNAWNVVPWVVPPSPSANLKGTGSGPNSPLGKHSRNGKLLKVNGSDDQQCSEPKSLESSIVVPKTLRIDDPEEAAKSSIWETLGIKYDSVSREGLFKALQPKGDEKKVTVSAALHANPAAFSRSISFRETA